MDGLNSPVSESTDQLEVADAKFRQAPEPDREDAIALLNSHVVFRTELQNGLEALDAPEQIADLHALLVEGHAAVLVATELLPARLSPRALWNLRQDTVESAGEGWQDWGAGADGRTRIPDSPDQLQTRRGDSGGCRRARSGGRVRQEPMSPSSKSQTRLPRLASTRAV